MANMNSSGFNYAGGNTPTLSAELPGSIHYGLRGPAGPKGEPFKYEDFTQEQLESLKVKGDKGDPGIPGIPGADGKDGYTPVKGVDYFDGQPGKDGVDGSPGVKGDPGVWVGSEAPPSSDYTVWVDPAGEGSGSSASVQSDWNASEGEPGYIKNKPFYEKREVAEGDTIYWDGNIEGREELDSYWWVSDAVPTMADFANGAYIDTTFEGAGTVASEQISDSGSGLIICDAFIVVYGDVDGMRKGTYLRAMSFDEYVSSLTIPGYTGFVAERVVRTTIEPKFLPNALKNPGIQGAVSTSDICAVAKSKAFYLNVGETTYQELNNLCYYHVIYDIRYEGKTYLGLLMSVSGYSGGGETCGNAHIVAIDYDGFLCTIDIKTNNASDWDYLEHATVATVNVTYPMNQPT